MKLGLVISSFIASAYGNGCAKTACPATQRGFTPNEQVFLKEHNRLRLNHPNTPCLILDSALSATAQVWAEELARSKNFRHAMVLQQPEKKTIKW